MAGARGRSVRRKRAGRHVQLDGACSAWRKVLALAIVDGEELSLEDSRSTFVADGGLRAEGSRTGERKDGDDLAGVGVHAHQGSVRREHGGAGSDDPYALPVF